MGAEVLGLDIGGANLKAAHARGGAMLQLFELWKHPNRLAEVLDDLLGRTLPYDRLAVTMTGELCDCFETRSQGVRTILEAVMVASRGKPIRVWRMDGQLVDPALALAEPLQVAAANWHALATYVGRWAPEGTAVLIDSGSTTTDVIPMRQGRPVPRGLADHDRLRFRELVYTGVRRTPVCALLGEEGAAEFFATMQDVYLLLEQVPEHEGGPTADGRLATRAAAHARLARMVCADGETMTQTETRDLAQRLARRQALLVRSALAGVVAGSLGGVCGTVFLAGSGEFLARAALTMPDPFPCDRLFSLRDELGPTTSEAACAHAVAVLAAEEIQEGC